MSMDTKFFLDHSMSLVIEEIISKNYHVFRFAKRGTCELLEDYSSVNKPGIN